MESACKASYSSRSDGGRARIISQVAAVTTPDSTTPAYSLLPPVPLNESGSRNASKWNARCRDCRRLPLRLLAVVARGEGVLGRRDERVGGTLDGAADP